MDELMHLRDLTPDARNARRHNSRNVGMITDALHEVGAARSIVVDENLTVLAGNATIEAAAAAGIERVQVVDTDGETIIAVRRSNLTERQKTRLALFDNRAAELAEWDVDILAGMMDDGIGFSGLWSDVELDWLLHGPNTERDDPHEHWQGMPEFGYDDQRPAQQIIVSFATREDVAEFARVIDQPLTPQTKSIWFPQRARNDNTDIAYRDDDER